jgi:putative FmdB family regulatory protein
MPTYDYRCEKCHKAFSLILTMLQHDRKKVACPKCGSHVVKQQIRPFYAVTGHKT